MIVWIAQMWLAVVPSGSTLPGKLLTRLRVRSHIWDHFDQHNTGAIASSHEPRGTSAGVWTALHVIFLLKAWPYSNIELKKRYLLLKVCDLHQLMLWETACTITCAPGSIGIPGQTWKLYFFSKMQMAGLGAQPLVIFAIFSPMVPLCDPVVVQYHEGMLWGHFSLVWAT